MDNNWGEAALSALGGVVGGVGGWIQGRKNRKHSQEMQRKQFAFDREMADLQFGYDKEQMKYAFDQNLEMWHLQNAYNDPSMQMQRLKEAGINPHTLFGKGMQAASGQAGPGASMGAAKYQAPRSKFNEIPPQIAPALAGFQNWMLTGATIQKAEAEADMAKTAAKDKAYDFRTKLIDDTGFTHDINQDGKPRSIRNRYARQTYQREMAAAQAQDSRQILAGRKLENALKSEALKMAKFGITSSNADDMRNIVQMMLEDGYSVKEIRTTLITVAGAKQAMNMLRIIGIGGKLRTTRGPRTKTRINEDKHGNLSSSQEIWKY